MEGYVYLIESIKTQRRYLGSTINPVVRIKEHNTGQVNATRDQIPWKCIMVINIGNITEARKIEYYIKKQKEKLIIQNIIGSINRYFKNKGM